ncbi:DUF7144 family membrane protein [Nocardiopsis suaedae]|uniref:DUF7144 domain-containing protein n=1 Tax=Nocardiopsis suaedae TaxID=3018444 RepID=A0ABT4TJ50_9ACTN|nr:hypothetical protein [Nocardiopsis suaedae]MDA2804289.1 hypothetical protein [Nocardiopsis suaedae]
MEASRTNGWMVFGAVLLLMIGAVNLVQGIVAMMRPDYYAVAGGEMLVLDMSGWGLLLTVWGAVLMAAGLALFTGHMWARTLAVVLVGVNAVAQLGFLAAFPLWSLVAIAVDVLAIYGLTAGWPSGAPSAGAADSGRAYRAGQSDAQAAPVGTAAQPGPMAGADMEMDQERASEEGMPQAPKGRHAQPME